MPNERLLLVRIKRLGGMGVAQRGFCYPSVSALCGVTCAALTKILHRTFGHANDIGWQALADTGRTPAELLKEGLTR